MQYCCNNFIQNRKKGTEAPFTLSDATTINSKSNDEL
jgi:hypothetical protein